MLSREKYIKLNKKLNIEKEIMYSYEDILDYYNQMRDISDNPEIKDSGDEDIINIIELYFLYYGLLSFSTLTNVQTEKFKEKSMYSAIFSTIANSIISVKYLVSKGLDYQANVIVRQLFEMCMLLLNVVIDNNKTNILMNTEMTEENLKIWRKSFSPKELNKTIEEYEGDFLSDWRKRAYSWYSNYAHNDFFSFFLFSFSRPITKEEKLFSNVWGGYVSRVSTTLTNMAYILWYTSKAFMKIVVDKNTDITKEFLAEEMELWNLSAYIFCITDKYFEEYALEHQNVVDSQ